MDNEFRFWRDWFIPVLVAFGVLSLTNALLNQLELGLYDLMPPSLPTYLGSSMVALVLVWLASRKGKVTRRDLGLDLSGWSAPRRLGGLVIILFMGLGGYSTLPPPTAETVETLNAAEGAATSPAADSGVAAPATWPKPSWGDYCFWFVFLLAASLTELLVFVSVGFCFTERWLRARGVHAVVATGAAALFASVAFGLYHFTHPPEFYGYVFFPLMPVMLLNLTLFVLTRNFWLTLALHNAFAAVGFTQLEYASYPPPEMYTPATYLKPDELSPVLISFLVPFLLLNLLEWGLSRRPPGRNRVGSELIAALKVVMNDQPSFWRDCCAPIVLAIGLFSLTNALWNAPAWMWWHDKQVGLYDFVPHPLPTYLGGSAVALLLIWRAVRARRLSSGELGLNPSGWAVPNRLAGLATILVMGLGGYAALPPPAATTVQSIQAGEGQAQTPGPSATVGETGAAEAATWPKPGWGDYCFWFLFILSASLTELLVFVSIGFCFTERWLRRRGVRPLWAGITAAVVASVAFGLYHYTYPPEFWGNVYVPLMPVMLVNLAYFALTRNFWLTLLLHNSFAAVGFTQLQYASYPPPPVYDPATYLTNWERMLAPDLIAFWAPFLALNLLEWKGFPAPSTATSSPAPPA